MKRKFESEIKNELKKFITSKRKAELLETVKKLLLFADKLEKMAWESDYSDLEKIYVWNMATNILIRQMEMTPEEHEEQRKRNEEWETAILNEKKKTELREKKLQ